MKPTLYLFVLISQLFTFLPKGFWLSNSSPACTKGNEQICQDTIVDPHPVHHLNSNNVVEVPPIAGGEILMVSGPCVPDSLHEVLRLQNIRNIDSLGLNRIDSDDTSGRSIVLLGWPLAQAPGFNDPSYYVTGNYVDHDNTAGVRDYNCGTRTYNGHKGIDIGLWPFAWHQQAIGQVDVIAAQAGVIINKFDGNSDQNCSCESSNWNAVFVQHSDGSVAWYGHLKNGSLTNKSIGQSVSQGEYLGKVASSGCSTGPHLHFELYANSAQTILVDPYAGPCNSLNGNTSWWANQKPYTEPNINKLMTHGCEPSQPGGCPANNDIVCAQNVFTAGTPIIVSANYRDQQVGHLTTYAIKRPNNTVWNSWTHTSPSTYLVSWWLWNWVLAPSEPAGVWTFEATYQGQTRVHNFTITGTSSNLSVSPTTWNPNASGGSQVVSVTSNVTWTATEAASWLSLTNPSGSNNGAFTIVCSPNTSTSSRSATVTVTGNGQTATVTVTQSGTAVQLSVSPTTWNPNASGGSQVVSVTSNVTWTATETTNWLSLTNPSGSNNGAFTIVCSPNTGASSRSATVTVSGGGQTATVQVNQAGITSFLAVDPTVLQISAEGNTFPGLEIFVSSNASWTATEQVSWLSLDNETGSGDGTFLIYAESNLSANSRSATVTITGGGQTATVQVTQLGGPVNRVCNGAISLTCGQSLTNSLEGALSTGAPSICNDVDMAPRGLWYRFTGNGNIVTINLCDNPWNTKLGVFTGVCGNLTCLVSDDDFCGDLQGSQVSFTSVNGTEYYIYASIFYFTTGQGPFSGDLNIQVSCSNPSFLTLNPTSVSFPASGNTQNIAVTSNVNWTATQSATWLSLVNPSGSNNGAFSISCLPNTSTSSRSATVTVTGNGQTATVTVTQAGASFQLAVSPTTWNPNASGGNQNIAVTSNVVWTATEAATWLSLVNPSGTNNGTFTISCVPNTSTSSRSATVTVTGNGQTATVTVTQAGASFQLAVSPTTWNPNASGGNQNIAVTSNVTWSATEAATWLSLTNPSGSNNGTLTINCDPNTSTSSRSATVTVTGNGQTATVTVTQAGASFQLAVSPTTWNPNASGGNQNIAVTSNVTWSATEAATWLSLTNPSGSNNGTITINCDPNTSTSSRSATVTVTGNGQTATVTVTQAGASFQLAVSPTTWNPNASGGNQNIAVTSNVTWSATEAATWLSLTNPSGSNNGAFTINCDPNTSTSSRSTTVTVTGNGQTATVTVTQAGASFQLAVSPTTWNPNASGGNQNIAVTSNVTWSATEAATWLSLTNPSGSNNGAFTINCDPNTSTSSRSATVTVTGNGQTATVTVTQAGAGFQLTVSPTTWNFNASGGTHDISVAGNISWTATESATWLSLTNPSGSNNGAFTINCDPNTSTSSRSTTVTVTGNGQTATVLVTQGGILPWTPSLTGENHTIIIPANVVATLDGTPLQNGDLIGFFYEHNGSLHCSNFSVISGTNNSLAVYGSDATPPAKNGYSTGEVFKVKIYRTSTQQEFDAQVTFAPLGTSGVVTHTNLYANDGISMLVGVTATSASTLDIPLEQGWNMISSNIIPNDGDMLEVFSPIASSIVLIKNGSGATAVPIFDINGIGQWNIVEGYRVNANTATTLTITGSNVTPETTPIPITPGWQIIAYLRQQPASIADQLSGIASIVTVVKDNAGNSYIPEFNINSIGNMHPTQGYKLKATGSGTLTYTANLAPEEQEDALKILIIVEKCMPGHFVLDSTLNTGSNSTIIFPSSVANTMMHLNDEIGVFTTTGVLCGVGVFQGNNFAITVWGDDTSTPGESEGMVPGEVYQLKIWKSNDNLELPLLLTFAQGDDIYQEDDIEVVSGMQIISAVKEPHNSALPLFVFPNPATGNFVVHLPQGIQVLDILDTKGRFLQRYSKPGDALLKVDATDLPKGLLWVSALDETGKRWYAKVILQ